MTNTSTATETQAATATTTMTKTNIITQLQSKDTQALYDEAHKVSLSHHGNIVHLRALIECSNHCRRQCIYCGLSCHNTTLQRYRMSVSDVIDTANEAYEAGYKTIVIQSGEDNRLIHHYLPDIVAELSATGMTVTLSCGETTRKNYEKLFMCGATRYLLKHETADPVLYGKLHPDSTLDHRLHEIRLLKEIGYEIGSGFMIGLPGQTIESIADDILLLHELKCDMAGIGTFIPHPATPLGNAAHGDIELTKKAIALTRILLPTINLPATTSLNVLSGSIDGPLSGGANVIMEKITPLSLRKLYEIYPSSSKIDVEGYSIKQERIKLENTIKLLGKEPL